MHAGWNTYAAMALPGSLLYKTLLRIILNYHQIMRVILFILMKQFHFDRKLKAYEILKLRDEAFIKYHTDKNFLNLIEKKFGREAVNNT